MGVAADGAKDGSSPKIVENDRQMLMTHWPLQLGCQALKKFLFKCVRALYYCFHFLKLRFLSLNKSLLLSFTLSVKK